ncbi:uncharacterized protein J3R85_013678 [Psidium guajava]|nr:uncharacterized protein J3R85_013678 [Psidium guajava]
MIHLFLSKPNAKDKGDSDSAEGIIALLHQLGTVIWSTIVSSGAKSEARLWLCKSISLMTPLSPRDQRDLFRNMLRSKSVNLELASQLLQMVFEKRPRLAGSILAKRSHMLENFFKGNPRRTLKWFSNFDAGGGSDHKNGAKALSQFAFVNRDICWEELEWKGKHGQSPAMVATKPHYFLDLDVLRTVENFVEYVPEFWSSGEFAESLKDGEILSLDTKYFVELFVGWMYKDDSKDVWEAVDDFLSNESFSTLCNHLLISLQESELLIFVKSLSKSFSSPVENMELGNSSCWLEIVLSKCKDFASIDQLLLLNMVVNQGRQLLRLMRDEECQEEKEKVQDIVLQIVNASSITSSFAAILEGCLGIRTLDVAELLGLYSWVIHYVLSKECQTLESWESLFIRNGISFRKSGTYSILEHDGIKQGENWSRLDNKSPGAIHSKKKEKRRKKRRRAVGFNDDGSDDDDLFVRDDGQDVQSRAISWLLSTDGFSTPWTMPDLPEHLAKHCLSVWMKWVFPKQTDAA